MMVIEETNETFESLMNNSISFVLYTASYIIWKRKEQEKLLKQIRNKK